MERVECAQATEIWYRTWVEGGVDVQLGSFAVLGMTIDFSVPSNVTFTMIDYIHKILEDLPEDMRGETTSPATHHLFTINEDDPILLGRPEL